MFGILGYIKDYKTSAYALLLHTARKDLKSAEPIVKYLFHRSNILDQYPEVRYLDFLLTPY